MTTIVIPLLLTAVTGYFWGSLNSALIVSRFMRYEDIRKQGSGNAGATNMYRTHGKLAAILTIVGDFLKVVPAVLLARVFFEVADRAATSVEAGLIPASSMTVNPTLGFDAGYVAGLFVLLGHVFPIFFDFKGGKGVMPAFALVLLLNPPAFLVLLGIAVPVFLIFRIMSLVSVLNALLLPIVTVLLGLIRQTGILYETLFTLGYTVLVLYSHRDNIRRLLSGKEKPIVPRSDKDDGAVQASRRHDDMGQDQ